MFEGMTAQSTMPENNLKTQSQTTKLMSLLQSCLDHLEGSFSGSNNDAVSPIYFYAMAALQEHVTHQMATLQTQVSTLQAERQQCLDTLKLQRQQQGQGKDFATTVGGKEEEEFHPNEIEVEASTEQTVRSTSNHSSTDKSTNLSTAFAARSLAPEASEISPLSQDKYSASKAETTHSATSTPQPAMNSSLTKEPDTEAATPTVTESSQVSATSRTAPSSKSKEQSDCITELNYATSRTKSTSKSSSTNKPTNQEATASSDLSATANPTQSNLTPLELQKKAAMEKRRQEVLEQRKLAAAEQKRKKEEERRKFLEYEQRKQDMKMQAAKEAERMRQKAKDEEEMEQKRRAAAAAAFPNNSAKDSVQSPSSTVTSSTAASPASSTKNSPSISQGTLHATNQSSVSSNGNSNSGMSVPHLPKRTPTTASQNGASSHKSPSSPPPPPSSFEAPSQQHYTSNQYQPQQPSMPSHVPTGSDAKYRNMMNQQRPIAPPEPSPVASCASSETPQHVITALKQNILLQWALLPPTYQVLKPIPQLLCQVHTVFPPALGVPGHEYFSNWTPIVWTDLATHGAWDGAKLKKAVRKVRFFLHPDKLPRDFNDSQRFVCKLLWDVVNDAYEDNSKQQVNAAHG